MNYYSQRNQRARFSNDERAFQPRWAYFRQAHETPLHPPSNQWIPQYTPRLQQHPPPNHNFLPKYNGLGSSFPQQFSFSHPNQYVTERMPHRLISDEEWIRNFSEDRKRRYHEHEQGKIYIIKIPVAVSDILKMQREADQLMSSLQTTCEECRKQRIQLPNRVLEDKAKLDELLETLSNEVVQKSMAEKIRKRKLKRQKIKENGRNAYYKKQQEQEEYDRKKKEIEEWFEREQRKIEYNKREKIVQQELTVALHDIRQQQEELKNKMKKLKLLVKLKKSREEKQGNFPIADELFDKCQKQTRELLLRATAECQQNEQSVREFLSLEEDKKLLNEKSQKLKAREIQQWKEEREIALFGKRHELGVFHELWPLQELHKQTKTNFQSLINTRWQWDRFLHPEGTTIPPNFVEPPKSISNEWEKYALGN